MLTAQVVEHPGIVVGTWNLQRFSLAKLDAALYVTAAVVSAFDVLAVQEVVDPRALAKLLMLLPQYACCVSPPVGKPVKENAKHTYTER